MVGLEAALQMGLVGQAHVHGHIGQSLHRGFVLGKPVQMLQCGKDVLLDGRQRRIGASAQAGVPTCCSKASKEDSTTSVGSGICPAV